MLKIDQLPTEVLMKIFGYLRSYGEVSLVSRRFYDVVCSVHDSVSFSSIFLENGNHQSVMDSVKSTRRKISKLSIRLGYDIEGLRESAISDAVSIVKKFSATIKRLELRNVRIELSDFFEMLSWLPNAEHMVFTLVSDNLSAPGRQFSNKCLNLNQLKILEFYGCRQEILLVFNRIPAGVLKKLTISHISNLNLGLAGLFTQQSNIKELVLIGYNCSTLPVHIFDHLKLESLELHLRLQKYNGTHAKILSRQTKLIHLRLREGQVDDQILKVITNQLSELETLHIRVGDRHAVPFKRIEKLKKLKELKLQTSYLKIIETFAGLDNSRIHTLIMDKFVSRDNTPVDVIVALANSLPNLKELRFNNRCEYQNIAAVMQNFNFLEVLEMEFDYHIDANGLCQAIEASRCFNPKLTELKIRSFPCDESVLTKLAAVYPSLKKLDIHSSSRIDEDPSLLKAILTGFNKMESLSLCGFYGFSTEFVECIKEHKNKLKSITLGYFGSEYKFTAKHKKKLRVVFDVTKYQDGTLHLADTKFHL